MSLPVNFRKLSAPERRKTLAQSYDLDGDAMRFTGMSEEAVSFADVMIESAVGTMPVPLGIAANFVIDGESVDVPLATEEPSVVAACSYAARMIGKGGGFRTEAGEPVMTVQIALEEAAEDAEQALEARREEIRQRVNEVLPSMVSRGGGYRGTDWQRLPQSGLFRVHIHVDVRDAMGANALNSVGERLAPWIAEVTGGRVLMAILTNSARQRRARAEFRLPIRLLRGRGMDEREVARRIVKASQFAREDPDRAVTHNKGIMNGVSALALATGNDTRAIEAAVHAHAAASGAYGGLTDYRIDGDELVGSLELPLAFGTVGGAVSFHPVARAALRILGSPSSVRLSAIACAVGLAQNFAAVRALVSEGIQHGHMRLHAERLAWQAGAATAEIEPAADELVRREVFNLDAAREALRRLRTAAGIREQPVHDGQR
jgi:hydroxymethylglutaryl-CoA reductase